MDGIMQAPGGPTEDPTNGFKFGDCAIAYFDDVGAEEIDRLFRNLDLLLGRKTYEIFAGYWPHQVGGKKLFADGSAPRSFQLTRPSVSPNGLIVSHYRRDGTIKITREPTLDSPSKAEIARRKRVKREG
jgi:dihydrofolate reductase